MPKKFQPLTKEEKQDILKKHQEYVDKFNEIIAQDVSRTSLAAQSGDVPVPFLEFDNSIFDKMELPFIVYLVKSKTYIIDNKKSWMNFLRHMEQFIMMLLS